jgi:hypothetical protein
MKWVFGVMLATLAATVVINVLLLGYGGTRNDPVGRLNPVAYLPAPALPAHPTPTPAHGHGDDGRSAHAADD